MSAFYRFLYAFAENQKLLLLPTRETFGGGGGLLFGYFFVGLLALITFTCVMSSCTVCCSGGLNLPSIHIVLINKHIVTDSTYSCTLVLTDCDFAVTVLHHFQLQNNIISNNQNSPPKKEEFELVGFLLLLCWDIQQKLRKKSDFITLSGPFQMQHFIQLFFGTCSIYLACVKCQDITLQPLFPF